MPNSTYAKEWLQFAYKNLATAKLLFEVNHYDDIVGVDIQQALEKTIKSIFAYENKKIPKEHDLVKLYFMVENFIKLEDDDIIDLRVATNYYKEDRYPNPSYELPSHQEIHEILTFAEEFFVRIAELLKIPMNEIENVR